MATFSPEVNAGGLTPPEPHARVASVSHPLSHPNFAVFEFRVPFSERSARAVAQATRHR